MTLKPNKIFICVLILVHLVIAGQGIQIVRCESEAVVALNTKIESLPQKSEVTKEQAGEIKEMMDAYNKLTTAEKIEITDYEKLEGVFDKLVREEAITKGDHSATTQQNKKETSNVISAQVTEYTYEIKDKEGLSIIMRYTTDTNGDGKGDVPQRIVLNSPTGETYPIVSTSIVMKDGSALNMSLTWTSNYLQLDIAQATAGKWTIETSHPVTFSAMEYAGAKQEINPEEKDEENPTEEINDSPKKSGFGFLGILSLIGVIGTIIFIVIILKRGGILSLRAPTIEDSEEHNKKNEYEDVYPQTEEESNAEIEKSFLADDINDEEEYEEESVDVKFPKTKRNANENTPQNFTPNEITQEEIDEDDTIEEYEEGNTELLNKNATKEKEKEKKAEEDANNEKKNDEVPGENRENNKEEEKEEDPFDLGWGM